MTLTHYGISYNRFVVHPYTDRTLYRYMYQGQTQNYPQTYMYIRLNVAYKYRYKFHVIGKILALCSLLLGLVFSRSSFLCSLLFDIYITPFYSTFYTRSFLDLRLPFLDSSYSTSFATFHTCPTW